ncbi:hypothetical protein HMPREF0004_1870 [Achromobacter piechaudii ATCC 43553]|uniref:Uncharacterized protein n=1 Tax=Achromobacter piechaudii ATCC 43553 TaxID=742159 RepID=D4X8S3_9BURK|nr:hypothetical protein HMPREF0004_1870 [Achromobacter piechaudii ATCC 43553]
MRTDRKFARIISARAHGIRLVFSNAVSPPNRFLAKRIAAAP